MAMLLVMPMVKFIKVKGEGVGEEMWEKMVEYADDKGWKGGDYKKLNLPFEKQPVWSGKRNS